MDHVEVDVVKISRAVEELKAEMLKAQWLLQHGTIHASEDHILDSLSGLVGLSYLLAKRLGFNYSRLDRVLYKH
ncbi:MAG: MazG-like family protein, partial [Eubacteriales bacterium]